MKKTKFPESWIVFALQQPETGVKVEVGQSLTGEAVVSALEDIRNEEGFNSGTIQVDNGTEFTP